MKKGKFKKAFAVCLSIALASSSLNVSASDSKFSKLKKMFSEGGNSKIVAVSCSIGTVALVSIATYLGYKYKKHEQKFENDSNKLEKPTEIVNKKDNPEKKELEVSNDQKINNEDQEVGNKVESDNGKQNEATPENNDKAKKIVVKSEELKDKGDKAAQADETGSDDQNEQKSESEEESDANDTNDQGDSKKQSLWGRFCGLFRKSDSKDVNDQVDSEQQEVAQDELALDDQDKQRLEPGEGSDKRDMNIDVDSKQQDVCQQMLFPRM